MKDNRGIFFIIDDTNSHCGITDRLKAAVGLCWVAENSGMDFKFIHTAGFDIRDYLIPNQLDWSAELADVSSFVGMKEELSYRPPFCGLTGLKKDALYICKDYAGKNIIEMTGVPDWQKVWRDLFRKMFRPSSAVMEALKHSSMPDRYSAVNVRFINSLGAQEETGYNSPFPPETQRRIIEAVFLRIAECEKDSDVPIVLYSDSVNFLKIASERGFRTCEPEGVGHIMDPGAGDHVKLMTFVYMLQMSKAEKVYSILNLEGLPSNSLYKSQYPRYSAIIGDRPFIRL